MIIWLENIEKTGSPRLEFNVIKQMQGTTNVRFLNQLLLLNYAKNK